MVRALNSGGTPGQVAAGIALGASLGLTPLLSLHNLVVLLMAMVLDVSLAGFSLGWTLFVPVGFLLDPLFDAVGGKLLAAPSLAPLWTRLANTPIVALSGFNNTVVLGSVVCWVAAWLPLFFLMRWLVARYRATLYERLRKTRVFQVVQASSLYQYYRYFRP